MSKLPLTLFIFLSLLPLLFSLSSHPKLLQNSANTPEIIHVSKQAQLIAESACSATFYPDLCVSTVSSLPELRRRTIPEFISHTINVTMKEVLDSSSNCTSIRKHFPKKLAKRELHALDDCLQLFSITIEHLEKLISELSSTATAEKHYADIQTYLSAAMTNQDTCLVGLADSKHHTRHLIEGRINQIWRHLSNSLALMKKLENKQIPNKLGGGVEQFPIRDGFPTWLKRSDRRLLEAAVEDTPYDVVVAKDGSGDFRTINDALNAAPNKSETRFVIYIKKVVNDAYFEHVEVASNKWNIMFMGDGIGQTYIKGDRYNPQYSTFNSATVAVVGRNFIAKGISFENSAGVNVDQAVAFRSGSDFSAFYKCSFIAYQDTLYPHSLRQFYRECDIYGTVDFICGNAAAVFQNSNLYARKPRSNQKLIFTAQNRADPNQNTGFSILNSKVAAGEDLLPVVTEFRSFLGRPWDDYSRTVYMYSNMESLIDPEGWLEWDDDHSERLKTLYYGEYMNHGEGSDTSGRVTWPGYHVITSASEASQFTVANLIDGNRWLPATGIPYFSDLTEP